MLTKKDLSAMGAHIAAARQARLAAKAPKAPVRPPQASEAPQAPGGEPVAGIANEGAVGGV